LSHYTFIDVPINPHFQNRLMFRSIRIFKNDLTETENDKYKLEPYQKQMIELVIQ